MKNPHPLHDFRTYGSTVHIMSIVGNSKHRNKYVVATLAGLYPVVVIGSEELLQHKSRDVRIIQIQLGTRGDLIINRPPADGKCSGSLR